MLFNRVFSKEVEAEKEWNRRIQFMKEDDQLPIPGAICVERYEETPEERGHGKYGYQKHFSIQEKTLA